MTPTLIHLFDKVYIDDMQYIDSTMWGAVIYDGAADITDSDPSHSLWRGNNLADALGETSFVDKMAEIAALDKKYVIYADASAFGEIVAKWMKSATNMDQAAFDKFIDLTFHKKTRLGRGSEVFKAACKAAWSGAVAEDLSSLNVSYSIEFLLPSIFHNSSHAKKPQLKTLINNFVKRTYEDYIIESKWFVDLNFMKKSVQTHLGLPEGAATKDETNFLELPDLAIFDNAWFNESGTKDPGSNGKVDLSTVPSSDLDALKTTTDKIMAMMGDLSVFDNWAYLSSVAGSGLTDEEFNSVIESIKTSNYMLPYIPWAQEETIVFEFLSYVQDLAVNADTTTLQKYSLK